MISPTKDEMVKAFAKYCKEDIDETDANDVAVVFYHAYLEAVSALREAHKELSQFSNLDFTIDTFENNRREAILKKAPEANNESK